MLKGLGNLGDMAKLMKQAQDMQGKMAELQAGLDTINVVGQSGGGMVVATTSAKGELKALEIDPSLLTPDDKEAVEDLIVAAIKDAQAKAHEAHKQEMAKLTEGLDLPPGMKMPF